MSQNKVAASLIIDDPEKYRRAFKTRCFVSYQKEDRAYVQSFLDIIRGDQSTSALRVWYEGNRCIGEKREADEEKELREADFVVMILSNRSLEGDINPQSFQYSLAVSLDKPVIGLVISDVSRDALKERYPKINNLCSVNDVDSIVNALLAMNIVEATDSKELLTLAECYTYGIETDPDYLTAVTCLTSYLPSAKKKGEDIEPALKMLYDIAMAIEGSLSIAASNLYIEHAPNDDEHAEKIHKIIFRYLDENRCLGKNHYALALEKIKPRSRVLQGKPLKDKVFEYDLFARIAEYTYLYSEDEESLALFEHIEDYDDIEISATRWFLLALKILVEARELDDTDMDAYFALVEDLNNCDDDILLESDSAPLFYMMAVHYTCMAANLMGDSDFVDDLLNREGDMIDLYSRNSMVLYSYYLQMFYYHTRAIFMKKGKGVDVNRMKALYYSLKIRQANPELLCDEMATACHDMFLNSITEEKPFSIFGLLDLYYRRLSCADDKFSKFYVEAIHRYFKAKKLTNPAQIDTLANKLTKGFSELKEASANNDYEEAFRLCDKLMEIADRLIAADKRYATVCVQIMNTFCEAKLQMGKNDNNRHLISEARTWQMLAIDLLESEKEFSEKFKSIAKNTYELAATLAMEDGDDDSMYRYKIKADRF